MTHEQAAADMVIDSIREQIRFTKSTGMLEANARLLIDAIAGSIAIYDETRENLHKIDEAV